MSFPPIIKSSCLLSLVYAFALTLAASSCVQVSLPKSGKRVRAEGYPYPAVGSPFERVEDDFADFLYKDKSTGAILSFTSDCGGSSGDLTLSSSKNLTVSIFDEVTSSQSEFKTVDKRRYLAVDNIGFLDGLPARSLHHLMKWKGCLIHLSLVGTPESVDQHKDLFENLLCSNKNCQN